MRTDVVVVGAGLGGLHAAALLTRLGLDCIVLEARDRIGGRILSVPAEREPNAVGPDRPRYDLGPAWFWPDMQPRMRELTDELGLFAFPQYSDGAVLVERFKLEPPLRYERGFDAEPRSMRLAGGMLSLAEAMAARLPRGRLRLGARVTKIGLGETGRVEVEAAEGAGCLKIETGSVILALPPRLVAGRIAFSPGLPSRLHGAMAAVPTWMAGQAKLLAVYDTPFWRERGLSGTASSFVGPLGELHDASAPDGRPALFGFAGLSASARKAMGQGRWERLALSQLARLFGPQAEQPAGVFVADWAADPDTATPSDWEPPGGHPAYGPLPEADGPWASRLFFAGTEVAAEHGGYLEGAIESAVAAVERLARYAPRSGL